MKAKAIKIICGVLVVLLAGLILFFSIKNRDSGNFYDETTEKETEIFYNEKGEVITTEPSEFETLPPSDNVQLGITAGEVLKIHSVGERGGRICVVAENISDRSIEHAVLTVMAGKEKLSFNVSAVLSGMKAVLACNTEHIYNKDLLYTSWKLDELIFYNENPTLNGDAFELGTADGSVSLKNISGRDIEGNIYICYKQKEEGIYSGSRTYRLKLSGLEDGDMSVITTDIFRKDLHEVIFIQYDK